MCICYGGYRQSSTDNTTCEAVPRLAVTQTPCTGDTNCTASNSQCNITAGMCMCFAGYRQSSTDNTTCEVVPRLAVTETPCTGFINCTANNSKCDTVAGMCICSAGYRQSSTDNTTCEAVPRLAVTETPCTGDSNCTANNSKCDAVARMCMCSAGYSQSSTDNTTCDAVPRPAVTKTPCTENTNCTATNSVCNTTSLLCMCSVGFMESRANNTTCVAVPACFGNTYGPSCNLTCSCVKGNSVDPTQSCDPRNGTCLCTLYWQGVDCSTDVDECSTGKHNCTKSNEGCHNLAGGYNCSCLGGYIRNNNGDCISDQTPTTTTTLAPGFVIVRHHLVLNVNLGLGVNLDLVATYEYYRVEVLLRLYEIYTRRLLRRLFRIFIKRLRKGSLEVDYDVIVLEENVPDVVLGTSDIAAKNATVPMFNESATPTSLYVNNIPMIVNTNETVMSVCEIYEAAAGGCGENRKCSVINEKPACEPLETEDNLPLILGLAVGIPLFFVTLAALLLCIAYYHRMRRKDSKDFYNGSDDRGSSIFSSKIAPRIHTGVPVSPYHHTYRTEDFLESEEYFSLPFQDDFGAQYYSRGEGPNQTFSWDYLFNYLGNEEFKIRRPKVDLESNWDTRV